MGDTNDHQSLKPICKELPQVEELLGEEQQLTSNVHRDAYLCPHGRYEITTIFVLHSCSPSQYSRYSVVGVPAAGEYVFCVTGTRGTCAAMRS